MTSARRWTSGLVAASLPLAATAIALVIDVAPGQWRALQRPAMRRVLADALLLELLLVMIVAPLAGVWLRRRPADLVILAVIATAVSGFGLLFLIGWPALPAVLPIVAASHASLLAAALLFSALGSAAGSRFRDALDAAAISLGAASLLTVGPLITGPLLGAASPRTMNLLLGMNPLVTLAAAADIDVLRMDVLYQLSPIAHRQFSYPSWPVSAIIFVALAAVLLAYSRRPASSGRVTAAA